ncbi:MAG: CvpA family protein [Dehalococcoidia bacterium]|nr:CvpA family protein [Dehalococcoidia bacterium]
MNWLDFVLLAVIGFSTWRAYSNGFIRELVSIAAVVLAIPIAGVLYDDMYPKVEPIITNRTLAAVLSFLSIFAGVIILGQVGAHLLKRTAEILNLGVLDRLSGGAFGFIKAVIICQVVLIVLVRYPEPDLRDDIDASPVATALLDAAPTVLAFLPNTFEEGLDLFREARDAVNGALGTPTPEP